MNEYRDQYMDDMAIANTFVGAPENIDRITIVNEQSLFHFNPNAIKEKITISAKGLTYSRKPLLEESERRKWLDGSDDLNSLESAETGPFKWSYRSNSKAYADAFERIAWEMLRVAQEAANDWIAVCDGDNSTAIIHYKDGPKIKIASFIYYDRADTIMEMIDALVPPTETGSYCCEGCGEDYCEDGAEDDAEDYCEEDD